MGNTGKAGQSETGIQCKLLSARMEQKLVGLKIKDYYKYQHNAASTMLDSWCSVFRLENLISTPLDIPVVIVTE